MATSYKEYKEDIKKYLESKYSKNATVLDVGAGDGTYWKYLGDYFENMYAVEIFKPNIENYELESKYKEVYNTDIQDFKYDYYDIIIFGDVIEHLDIEEADKVLKYALNRCKEMIVAVPYMYEQGIAEGNVYEIHKQPDLTNEVFLERYPYMECLYRNKDYGYYIKKSIDDIKPLKKTKKGVKVSVVVPVYNQEELISKCLSSIPERKDVEIIVVNDGSTDKTSEVLKNYKGIKFIDRKENRGVSYTRNEGLEEAVGEYVLFLDSDDYIYPDVFNEIVDNYLINEADFVYYNMENNYDKVWEVSENLVKTRVGMFKFIRREFIDNLRFPVGLQYGEDREFTLKLLERNPKTVYTGLLMYHYNYPREGSLSFKGEKRRIA